MSAASVDPRAGQPAANPAAVAARVIARARKLRPATLAGAIIVSTALLTALLAPLIAPYDPNQIDLVERLAPPSLAHPAGTDEVGRDIFSRILIGTRASLGVGLGIVLIGATAGTAIGCYAGYKGGWVDGLIMRAVDSIMALPVLVIALALTAALGPSLMNAMIALGLLTVPQYTRLARSQALGVRETGYVLASATMGATTWYQLRTNVLPNVASPILVYATLNVGTAILAIASLSFIGLGAQPPMPEWGSMISAGRTYIVSNWWYPFLPGLAITLTVLGFNLLGDGLRDAMDPHKAGTK